MGIRNILLASSALALTWSGQAFAQSATDTAPGAAAQATDHLPTSRRASEAAAKSGVVVEELIVTGAKKIDDLKTLPVAATTFTAEQRNLTATNTMANLVALTPGITISANGLSIRGVGRQTSETATIGSVNPASYYVNGFYEVVSTNIGESTLYSETVQFERGPQGTRGGRESMAGTASLTARRPTTQVQGEAVAQYGSNEFWGAGANVAGPLTDTLGVRLGYQHFGQGDSYQHNIFPGVDAGGRTNNNYYELQLEWRPTDRFHAWLRSTTFDYTNPTYYAAPATYNTVASMGSLVPNPTFGYATPAPKGRDINVDAVGVDRLRNDWVHILNADYDFGGVKLEYIGGYLGYKANGYSDYDGAGRINYVACTPSATATCAPGTAAFPGVANGTVIPTQQIAVYNNRDHYFTHEVRFENTDKSKLDWVVGAFYFNSAYNEAYEQNLPGAPAMDAPIESFTTFAPAAPNPDRSFYQQHNVYKTNSLAGFGDILFHLNASFDVYGGLRYSVERGFATTQIRYVYYNPAYGLALDVTPGTPGGAAGSNGAVFRYDDRAWTGRVGVDYHLNDDTLLYAKYSRGFLPSAFNLGNVNTTTNNVAGQETLDAYEAGWKETFGPSFRADATVFYYDYHDLQIPLTAVNPVTKTAFFAFTNFPKSRSYGLELQGTWTPTSSLWLNANYSYLNAKTVSFCCGVDPTDPTTAAGVSLDGRVLPRSPKHKASVSGAYTWDFSAGSLILGGSVSYMSSQQQDAFDNPNYRIPAYALLNANVTWRSADNHYELSLQGTNLLDKVYPTRINNASDGGGGIAFAPVLGAPQSIQAVLRYRW